MPMENRTLPGRHITDCQRRLYMNPNYGFDYGMKARIGWGGKGLI
jgi:hypothetical protein